MDLRFFNFVPACGPDEGLNRAKGLPCWRRSRCLRSDISSQDLMRLKSIHPSTASFWALSRGSDRSHPLSASAAFAAFGVGGGKRIQRSGSISLLCRKRRSQTNGAFDRSAAIPSVSYRGVQGSSADPFAKKRGSIPLRMRASTSESKLSSLLSTKNRQSRRTSCGALSHCFVFRFY